MRRQLPILNCVMADGDIQYQINVVRVADERDMEVPADLLTFTSERLLVRR